MQTIDTQENISLANMPLFSMANMDNFEAEIRASERQNSNNRIMDLNIQLAEMARCANVENYKALESRHYYATWCLIAFLAYSLVATVLGVNAYVHYRALLHRGTVEVMQ